MQHQEKIISSYEPTSEEHERVALEQEANEILLAALTVIEQENTRFDFHGEKGENEHFMDKMTDLNIKAQGTKAAILGEFFDKSEDPAMIPLFQELMTKGKSVDQETRRVIKNALVDYLAQKLADHNYQQSTDTKH